MTLEQRKDLEDMLNYYEWKQLLANQRNDTESAFIHEDRIRQIQEVLEVLDRKAKRNPKNFYQMENPITAIPSPAKPC